MIYLDNAATTFPKPENVINKLTNVISKGIGTPGRGKHGLALKAGSVIDTARRNMARFFGTFDDYRAIFTYSATDSLNMVIKGFLDTGDHVIISECEHNSTLRPLKGLERDGKITLEIIPCDNYGYIDLNVLKVALRKKPKLVVIAHSSNVLGTVQPIDEIYKLVYEAGSFMLLDAAQSAGVLPINIKNNIADFIAFSGHKSLFGLQGTGGLIIGDRVTKLRSFREGGTGYDSLSETQPVNWPEAYEAGTHNVVGIISISEGINFINAEGISKIHQKEILYRREIINALKKYNNITLYGELLKNKETTSVLSFNIDGWDAQDIGEVLNKNYNIYVRTGLQCSPLTHKRMGSYPEGSVRVSPGYFNKEDEIEEFIKVILRLAKTNVSWY